MWGMGMGGMPMPSMQMPNMQMPGMSMPGMQMPGMQMPGMQMPNMQMPGMQMPAMPMAGMNAAPTQAQPANVLKEKQSVLELNEDLLTAAREHLSQGRVAECIAIQKLLQTHLLEVSDFVDQSPRPTYALGVTSAPGAQPPMQAERPFVHARAPTTIDDTAAQSAGASSTTTNEMTLCENCRRERKSLVFCTDSGHQDFSDDNWTWEEKRLCAQALNKFGCRATKKIADYINLNNSNKDRPFTPAQVRLHFRKMQIPSRPWVKVNVPQT